MKKRIYLPKLVPLCPLMRSQALSPPVSAKVRYCQYRNWRRHISHSQLNFGGSFFLAPYAVSSPSSLPWSQSSFISSQDIISSQDQSKENSDCSACGHPLQDLNHLLLDCRASEPFANLSLAPLSLFSIYGPDLGVWPDCWVSAEFLRAPFPRKGSGSTTTTVINRCQFISECESSSLKIVTRLVDFLTETSASFIPFQITLFLFVAIIN